MENKILHIEKIKNKPSFRWFHKLGLIDEIGLRNLLIKEEYKTLRHKLNNLPQTPQKTRKTKTLIQKF